MWRGRKIYRARKISGGKGLINLKVRLKCGNKRIISNNLEPINSIYKGLGIGSFDIAFIAFIYNTHKFIMHRYNISNYLKLMYLYLHFSYYFYLFNLILKLIAIPNISSCLGIIHKRVKYIVLHTTEINLFILIFFFRILVKTLSSQANIRIKTNLFGFFHKLNYNFLTLIF